MTQRAAERAAVAGLPMSDLRDRLVHQRAAPAHQIGEFDVALARHRANFNGADFERAIVLADVAQAVDPIEIDDMVGQHVAHVEHRHQRLPAGEQFGVVEAAEKADDVGQRCADRDRKRREASCRTLQLLRELSDFDTVPKSVHQFKNIR